jgi:hypothetical protein
MFNNKRVTKYLCPCFASESDRSCFILLEGDCLHTFVMSSRNNLLNAVLTEEEIWGLIQCMC